jgi:WD40 repeat protein
VNGLAFAPDGKLLASASSDATIKLWNVVQQREENVLSPPRATGEIRCVAWSPDGKLLAAGTRYGLVKVWDPVAGREVASLRGHEGDVWCVAFSPNGRTLASGNGDWDRPGKIKLWDTATWRLRRGLQHSGEVLCLAYAPDGRFLAAGSWDRTVKMWRLRE